MKTLSLLVLFLLVACEDGRPRNTSALDEQAATEVNQQNLFAVQPPPKISWSLERDNLIKRFKLQNDRTVMFYMYIFVEGIGEPVGYYQVNKVSSVNSQLTNSEQIVNNRGGASYILPSPAEDGSYGTNGDAVFGFTPQEIYIEHNMKYVVSTVPLAFKNPRLLTVISLKDEKDLKVIMDNLK
jgi:hypothetical protein